MLTNYRLVQTGEAWRLQQQGFVAQVTAASPPSTSPQSGATSFHASLISAVAQDPHLQQVFAGKFRQCDLACRQVRSTDQVEAL